jgi:hypothetical protein
LLSSLKNRRFILKRPNIQKKARKYKVDSYAVCSECEAEWYDKNPDKWAKEHALKTGHIVSIIETHDVAAFEV